MTEPSKNLGWVQWLTFFEVEHGEGGKGGEGGVYPFYRLYHLSLGRFGKMSRQCKPKFLVASSHNAVGSPLIFFPIPAPYIPIADARIRRSRGNFRLSAQRSTQHMH